MFVCVRETISLLTMHEWRNLNELARKIKVIVGGQGGGSCEIKKGCEQSDKMKVGGVLQVLKQLVDCEVRTEGATLMCSKSE